MGSGVLSTIAPKVEPPDGFLYDPSTPVPSSAPFSTGHPSFDQRDIEMRADVLVYSTTPLEHGIEVTGPLSAVLYVTSTAPDTDFTAKLVDVSPDGTANIVQEGILRARYREGFDKRAWMKPGEIYPLVVDIEATSNYFAPGHRIRVEISSSSFPRFDRNLNTGKNNYDETASEVANNFVHHSAAYPSHVILPIDSGGGSGN
jgi:hypothetical protein